MTSNFESTLQQVNVKPIVPVFLYPREALPHLHYALAVPCTYILTVRIRSCYAPPALALRLSRLFSRRFSTRSPRDTPYPPSNAVTFVSSLVQTSHEARCEPVVTSVG